MKSVSVSANLEPVHEWELSVGATGNSGTRFLTHNSGN